MTRQLSGLGLPGRADQPGPGLRRRRGARRHRAARRRRRALVASPAASSSTPWTSRCSWRVVVVLVAAAVVFSFLPARAHDYVESGAEVDALNRADDYGAEIEVG